MNGSNDTITMYYVPLTAGALTYGALPYGILTYWNGNRTRIMNVLTPTGQPKSQPTGAERRLERETESIQIRARSES